MILSKYIRVMDIGWEDFLWGAFWAVLVIAIYTAMIMSSAYLSGQENYKKTLPRKYKEQDIEINDLKEELKMVMKERDGFETRLKTISLSSAVKGE